MLHDNDLMNTKRQYQIRMFTQPMFETVESGQ